jgi:hypothetical protein
MFVAGTIQVWPEKRPASVPAARLGIACGPAVKRISRRNVSRTSNSLQMPDRDFPPPLETDPSGAHRGWRIGAMTPHAAMARELGLGLAAEMPCTIVEPQVL